MENMDGDCDNLSMIIRGITDVVWEEGAHASGGNLKSNRQQWILVLLAVLQENCWRPFAGEGGLL